MLRVLTVLLLGFAGVFASEDHGGQTDIIPRVVNFLIFAGILYYLIAGFVRNFFAGRRQGIADEFDKIQQRLDEAKQSKEKAASEVEKARITADEIIATARKEAQMMAERIKAGEDQEVRYLARQKEESQQVMRNKMIRTVVEETMSEILESKDLVSENKELIHTLIGKVA